MNRNTEQKRNNNKSGFVVITTVIFFLIISIAVISAVVIPTSNQVKSVLDANRTRQSYIAADDVNEDALYRLKLGKTLPSTLSLPFSNGVLASAIVTTVGTQQKVTATGQNGQTSRYAETFFSPVGTATGFEFSAQVGEGGMHMSGGAYVNGSVYSNGSVTTDSSGPHITESLTVANGEPATVNQTNGYVDNTSPVFVEMGKLTATQDVAQSFKVSSDTPLTSIRLYVKKTLTGSPANATLRIVPDLAGKPSNTGVIGTGALNANAVTTSFTYINIPILQAPSLTPGSTYWLVIDTPSVSTTKYFTLAGTNNTYSDGVGASGSWNSNKNKNTWVNISPSNTDLYFDIYLGGSINGISGNGQWNRLNIATSGSGYAWANDINSVSVSGSIYCQTGTYLYNQSNSAQTCDTSRADPTPLSYPITAQNIQDWKDVAVSGGVINSNYSIGGGQTVTMGPKKIVGNLTVSGGATLKLTGTVWVTGYIDLSGGSVIKLDPSAGDSDGMIIADGRIVVTGGAYMRGSGTSGSYMVAMTTSQCPVTGNCSGPESGGAINVEGGSGSVVMFAPYGTLMIKGGARVNSAVAYRVILDGGSYIDYDSGLSDIDFITGSGGGGGSSSGGWKVDSWSEVSQ